jgi:mevalonate kinase
MKATSSAPGKIILSGEHAVVYGKPALITAVASFVQCEVTPSLTGGLSFGSDSFATYTTTAEELRSRRIKVLEDWERFGAGQIAIIDVLSRNNELQSLCWAELDADYPDRVSPMSAVNVSSELPVGCGMGSSAAVCAAALSALAVASDVTLQKQELYQLCLRLERFQHGTPSGADPYIAVHGGSVLFEKDGGATPVGLPAVPLHIVQTGQPAATTGEAVSEVRGTHGNSPIWDQFASITKRLSESIRAGDSAETIRSIRENHRLLVEIGVVPKRVQEFVDDVESTGGAAKISGAGTIRGDAAGAVLVCTQHVPDELCDEYGYSMSRMKGEPDGVRVLDLG